MMQSTIIEYPITVPLAEILDDTYLSNHVQVQLTYLQSKALKRAWIGLDECGERLRNGRRVASNADVIRWLLEQVPEKLP